MTLNDTMLKSLHSLNELGGLPKEREHLRIVTQKSINSFDFILAILAVEKIDILTVAFYRIGKKTIIELSDLLKKQKIKEVVFLINDGFPKLVPEAYNTLKSFEDTNWKIKLAHSHTKIILAETKYNYYVVEGSGNLSRNARIEQYCFDNNKKILQFHKNWINKI